MNTPNYLLLKKIITFGLILGFLCGFLYSIGGFVYDYLYVEINTGSYLALNALWGMPLIFGCLAFLVGVTLLLFRQIIKKLF